MSRRNVFWAKATVLIVILAVAAVVTAYAITMPRRAAQLDFLQETNESITPQRSTNHSPEYLERLRTEFVLDDIIAGATSDFDRVRAISTWVHGLWRHDGSNQPEYSDPIYILEQVAGGERFRCTEYALVIAGCLQALDIPARTVSLMTHDVETRSSGAGHVVAEAYLTDMGKWVFIDGQWNVIPVLEGLPLNAVEFQHALSTRKAGLELIGIGPLQGYFYRWWIAPYLYYFSVPHNSQRLMLGPVGASEPQFFQQKWPLGDIVYIQTPDAFYLPPVP